MRVVSFTTSEARPRVRRLRKTLRPVGVCMRERNPCVRSRLRTLGCHVRLVAISHLLQNRRNNPGDAVITCVAACRRCRRGAGAKRLEQPSDRQRDMLAALWLFCQMEGSRAVRLFAQAGQCAVPGWRTQAQCPRQQMDWQANFFAGTIRTMTECIACLVPIDLQSTDLLPTESFAAACRTRNRRTHV